jgi:hypothetical protein
VRQGPKAVGAALVLIVALGSGVLGQSPSASPLPSVAATTPVACLPVASAAPGASPGASTATCTVPAAPFAWQQADVPGISSGGITLSYMAFNSNGDMSLLGNAFPDQRKSGAWHSTDGLTWTPAKLDWKAKENEGGTSSGIAAVQDQFLTIANNSYGWTATSPTGETWKVDKRAVDGGKGLALLVALTSTPDGAAAGGQSTSKQTGTDPVPAVWTTRDGKAWSRTDLPPSSTALITTIAATPSGMLAAGAVGEIGKVPSALWVAPDGLTWQVVPLSFLDTESYLRTLIATPSGLLMTVNKYHDKKAYAATIWSSPDGLSWQQVHATAPYVVAASYGPLGIVVSTDTKLLRSTDDGATWSETPLPIVAAGTYAWLLAQTPDGRLMVGYYPTDGSSSSLWVGTPTP